MPSTACRTQQQQVQMGMCCPSRRSCSHLMHANVGALVLHVADCPQDWPERCSDERAR